MKIKSRWTKLRRKIKNDLDIDIGPLKLMNYRKLNKYLLDSAPEGNIDEFIDYFKTYENSLFSFIQLVAGKSLNDLKIYISEYATSQNSCEEVDPIPIVDKVAAERAFFIKFSKEVPNYLYLYHLPEFIESSNPKVQLLMQFPLSMHDFKFSLYVDAYRNNFLLTDDERMVRKKDIETSNPRYYRFMKKFEQVFLEEIKNNKYTSIKLLSEFFTGLFEKLPKYEIEEVKFFSLEETKQIFDDDIVYFTELVSKTEEQKPSSYIG